MSPRPSDFPAAAVRDLLGLVRALYHAARAKGEPADKLALIATIGVDLAKSLELARTSPPDSVGSRAARGRADRAAKRLGDVIALTDGAEPIVRAAMKRVQEGAR